MGRREDIAAHLRAITEPVIAREGVELVDIELLGSGPATILRFLIDKPGGVTLEDCTAISRAVEGILEVDDPLEGSYNLEVSSPGLDRPLKKPEDFAKFAGQRAQIKTFAPVGDRKSFTGTLKGYEDGHVVIDVGEGDERRVPVQSIAKAHLKYEFADHKE